ncbi:MAG: AraC family transcriptional regulator [Eubacteriales bacterium]|nr:AraC family transcriptional regulator [Eubacteriales bacterium]
MISYVATEYGWKDLSSEVSNDLLVSVLYFLQQHYCEKLTLEELANHFGYNKYYISKMWNRYVDLNFSEFVNSMRCHHAVELLLDKELSITNIAGKSGFESLRSFHRAFQKTFGCTPSDYRKQLLRNARTTCKTT